MLFNSYAFLLAFLPFALALHWLVARFRPEWRLLLLVALSFVFYGYWDWPYILLLALSIMVNWLLAEVFQESHYRSLITAAICINLLILGIFKYANFLASLIPAFGASGGENFGLNITLPLGISFFTFHHIMYLVDLRAGKAPRYDLTRYALYIAFFPQILSGPLVRWNEIMGQFDARPYRGEDATRRFALGIMLLVIGLAKKVLLADPLAAFVNPVFEAAAETPVSVIDAWRATLGFNFQIYFDFSGYTDMALGIALMLGIVLPQNFDVPYRATSVRDFWRRWHMTLSRFLRDYLYIPLGGNRYRLRVQIFSVMVTMALGGLWHGAGFTYIAWGTLHGIALCINLLWRRLGLQMPTFIGWALTMLFVVFAWVLFRAPSFGAAFRIYEALFGLSSVGQRVESGRSILAISALIAMTGPTAWTAVHQMPVSRAAAVPFAAVFVLILYKMVGGTNYQFIYFQF